ncbi:hypothetical protein [Alcanivorax sp. 1008]|uniref:hypothetical protein n=1 Tax=Alcanivorax sp. 1008 TaxID=2816853 RepID=UPI001D8748EC|nr:hypothetical protein [Alcanivorax sp. 1008]MCC1496024.1 hypothetical protein [Alcanivorax sp. 1008]
MRQLFRYSALTVAVCASVGLSGCKLSDLVDGDEQTSFVALQGTATTADGPMVGARVDIKDANGDMYVAYVESSGYFSLVQDPEDDEMEYSPLEGPIILRVDYNEQTYHSVLCNVVYSQFGSTIDTVNVHTLTDFAMRGTADVDEAYAFWDEANGEFCSNMEFAWDVNNLAYSLEGNGTFNFFNTLFSADNTGFDSVLRNFDPESFNPETDLDEAPSDFHLANGLGTLVTTPGTAWDGTATGTFAGETVNEVGEGIQIDITPEGLTATLEELLSGAVENEVELQSLSISAEGDGIGEVGTTAVVRLKGSAAIAGAGLVSKNFDITLDLELVEGGLIPPIIIIDPIIIGPS